MGRRRKGELPSYRLHKQSGQAIVSLPLGSGRYHDHLLGPYDSAQSKQEYARVIAEWVAGRYVMPVANPRGDQNGLSVAELILGYWKHAETYYRHFDGRPTSEQDAIRLAVRPLKQLYGHTQRHRV